MINIYKGNIDNLHKRKHLLFTMETKIETIKKLK